MLNGDSNENSKKTSVGLISKKTKTLQPRVAHFLLYISLLLFCTTTTTNFQKLVCSCSLFFRRRLFSPWWQLQLAFPLFLTAAIKLLCFLSNDIGHLWSLSLALTLPLLSMSMQALKLSRKKESAFIVIVFISKRPGSYTETRGCLKCKILSGLT